MSSFRKPTPVITRAAGAYVEGVWTLPDEPASVNVLMTVQPLSQARGETFTLEHDGRQLVATYKAYSSAKLNVAGQNNFPGDIVLHRDLRLIVIGVADNHALNSDVSHYKYFLYNELVEAEGEQPA